MKRRTAGVLMGVLALVSLALVLSVLYPFTTADPIAANPPEERFVVGDVDAFEVTASLVADGETVIALDGVATADGGWYQRVAEAGVVVEAYQARADAPVYVRETVTAADPERVEQRLASVAANEDSDLVCEDRDGDRVTFLVKRNGTDETQPVAGSASVFVNNLLLTEYEATGVSSSGVSVYRPESGWYESRATYRITNVSGEVRADADTHVVESAAVSFDMTGNVETYAGYVLARSFGDAPTWTRLTYEFEPGDGDLERPAWVDDAEAALDRRPGESRSDGSTVEC